MRLILGQLLLLASLSSAWAAEKPNIIVMLADDQGWGDLSLHGNTSLRTPHVDSLATDGARFEHFYVQPVCAPTRAEFLTGRWHPRGGVRGVSTGQERLNLDETTLADAFRQAGYSTGCFGKWHNGSQYPYHPNGRGFQEYYGFTSGHWGEYFDPPLDHNGQDAKGQGYLADDLTGRAIAFLQANAKSGQPSFCYLAFNTPHSPMQVPEKHWKRLERSKVQLSGSKKENVPHTRAALAMCENLDDNVGRVLAALKESKLESNTIIVYFSDNGPNGQRWNAGLRGVKGSTDEGGVRSPLHVRWPGHIKPGQVIADIAGAIDLYPTLAELAGIPLANGKPLDGLSFASKLLGKKSPARDRVLFSHWNGRVSARNPRFRLDVTGKLYDLTNDPGQTRDVAAQHGDTTEQLTAAVEQWKREVLGSQPKEDLRPFPVGYPELPRTVLPARDGVPMGGVQRSAPAPNCSFFTNWRTTSDQMNWMITVNQPGRYEAIVRYTCPEADTGSQVELTLGGKSWRGVVREAHDPPLRGQEHDRVDRGAESYVKDFQALSLGVMELPKGPGTLTLKATKIPGRQVADVRGVELILQSDQ